MECYKLTIECATEEVAHSIQEYVNNHYHDNEVFWNTYKKV